MCGPLDVRGYGKCVCSKNRKQAIGSNACHMYVFSGYRNIMRNLLHDLCHSFEICDSQLIAGFRIIKHRISKTVSNNLATKFKI